jgi:hypothetical protein
MFNTFVFVNDLFFFVQIFRLRRWFVCLDLFLIQFFLFLWLICLFVSAFRDRGIPKPTSECAACPSPDGSSAWASAKGGEARWPETGVREVDIPRPSCSSRAQVGCACSRGVTSVHAGEGSERPQESACLVLIPARPTSSKKALVLPFIVVRRGSRCTTGGCSRVLRV